MTPEIKDKWVAALRSGEYKQTRHTLKDEDGYCCLGVLCHITSDQIPNPFNIEEDDSDMGIYVEDEGSSYTEDAELPQDLRNFFGMSLDEHNQFVNANDIEKRNFSEIANLIEATYGEKNA